MILRPRYYAIFAFTGLTVVLAIRLLLAGIFDPFADFYYLTGWRTTDYLSVDEFAERKIKRRMIEDAAQGTVVAAIFGNSRAAALEPSILGEGAVNLSFSGARTEEVVLLLRRFKQLHPQAQTYVALDFDQCLAPISGNGLYLDPTQDVAAREDAWLRLTSLRSLEIWMKALLMGHSMPQIITPDGHVSRFGLGPDQVAARRDVDAAQYGAFFKANEYRYDCAETARMIRATDPRAVLFVNPLSQTMWQVLVESNKQDYLKRWRRELISAAPVLDFTCGEEMRHGAFLDGHHYGREIARSIMEDLRAFKGEGPLTHACLIHS